MDEILAALKANIDALDKAHKTDPDLEDIVFFIRVFILKEAYENLAAYVKKLKPGH